MIGLLLAASAASALPTEEAAWVETSTEVNDLAVSWDEAWVAFTTSGGELLLIDTATWDVWNVPLSSAAGGGVTIGGASGASTLFAGLADGKVEAFLLMAGSSPSLLGSFPVGGAPLALEADSQTLYALVEATETGPTLESYSVAERTPTGTEAADLGANSFSDMGARITADSETASATISYLYVTHGGSQVSRIAVSPTSMTPGLNESGGSGNYDDLWTVDGVATTWFTNSGGSSSVSSITNDSGTFEITNTTNPVLGDPTAVGGSYRDGWLGISNNDGLHVFTYANEGLANEADLVIPEAAMATEIVALNGYGVVGLPGGASIVSALPWVEITGLSATTVLPEEEFTLTFTSSKTGSWQAYRQVQGSGGGPEKFTDASGDVAAGEEVTATLSLPPSDTDADERFLVEIRVTEDGSTSEGRDGTFVASDPRPTVPDLSGGGVAVGDRAVYLKFDALDPEAAQTYQVWITTVPWAAEDYATGGPVYEGPDDYDAESTFIGEAGDLGVVEITIGALTNGTTYYVGVRAIDAADTDDEQESEMSTVYEVMPEETYSLSQRLGIESWCGLPLSSAGWFGVFAGVVALSRRKRTAKALGAGAALLVGLALPGVAEARPHEDDSTSRHWNVALRYGPFLSQGNSELKDAFGSSNNRLFRADLGWTSNLLDLDLGLGLYTDEGGQTTASGERSADDTKLTAFPLGVDATVRFDFLREQPVVPFVRAGGDLWLWNETWDSQYDSDGGGATTAGTFGWHWAGGLMILLDTLDPGAASKLENAASVNDTFLVAEYRQSYTFGSDALDFTSSEITFGLKFDY